MRKYLEYRYSNSCTTKMSEDQAPSIVEEATFGDVEDEIQPTAKSAEDRKAAAALSSLDARKDDDSATKDVDQEAVRQAMDRLSALGASDSMTKKKEAEKLVVKKAVKVDAADVALVVEELEMTKNKATEFLKAHDGDITKALRAYVTAAV